MISLLASTRSYRLMVQINELSILHHKNNIELVCVCACLIPGCVVVFVCYCVYVLCLMPCFFCGYAFLCLAALVDCLKKSNAAHLFVFCYCVCMLYTVCVCLLPCFFWWLCFFVSCLTGGLPESYCVYVTWYAKMFFTCWSNCPRACAKSVQLVCRF